MGTADLAAILQKHSSAFQRVVPFNPVTDLLYPFDFTETNTTLTGDQIADTERFAAYINDVLRKHGCLYGIGGYNEHRTIYARSNHFDRNPEPGPVPGPRGAKGDASGKIDPGQVNEAAEPRRLHLGIDIWGPAGTKVMAPLDGVVHSFAFNNNDSDYGATLILTHNLEGTGFHTLYGHLSLNSLKNLYEGKNIRAGEVTGEFGMRFENGNWPPHLHFQVIQDMQGWKGDYPGVCQYSQRDQWLENCPDPDLILQLNKYLS